MLALTARQKKNAPRRQPQGVRRSGLVKPGTLNIGIIAQIPVHFKPQFPPERRCLSVTGWALFFATLGVAQMVGRFFDLLDWIER